ncbi:MULTISPECIES: MBL fold metallo-hydrolase [unclassified Thermoactinomyces]|jgi:glyoxylase-like metal-dependent hydrolase (beta-lactamase superfamily II)|uniref:MBL fold metallo-hydrolase n=1 Tax=unclassified Thermoactinomyces TaxID=2634588 RepID=UPI0018DC198C|nr:MULTISPECIES: MBL fold metallo-hydrolase [unclassified Thermoactinomyces]MBH8597274.1 MBL fold metallo-hydrolase [Thermoactinomyces sp. CICC 10523]MBH8602835.1 MBL fold metallo-hydrolase [Thermoactinomyces sp. CICC 10522]MBH8606056.1 MBL fold metallo-hydrolase [Thermoactinomyces sp. CICC 10521]
MHQVHLLEIEFENDGLKQVYTPVLIQDEHEMILIDCGYPNSGDHLEKAAEQAGVSLSGLTRVIVTHHDLDHAGALSGLKKKYPHIEIIAHELERPYIEGKKKSLRLEQAEAMLAVIKNEEKADAERFISFLQTYEPATVDRTVVAGERLPWCGGIEIVHTPGHMPGHISLYLLFSKTMIAGDAVVVEHGRLNIANPQYTLDMEEALRSVRRLLDYDIDHLICYHGGTFHGDIKNALKQLIQDDAL